MLVSEHRCEYSPHLLAVLDRMVLFRGFSATACRLVASGLCCDTSSWCKGVGRWLVCFPLSGKPTCHFRAALTSMNIELARHLSLPPAADHPPVDPFKPANAVRIKSSVAFFVHTRLFFQSKQPQPPGPQPPRALLVGVLDVW